jgi:hypothetical protein
MDPIWIIPPLPGTDSKMRSMNRRPFASFTIYRQALGIFALFFAFLVLVSSSMWYGEYRLDDFGVETTGTVIRKEPREHWTVVFGYEVGGRQYTGRGSPETGSLPSMDEIRVGDPVRITYDPADPGRSRGWDPDRRFLPEYSLFLLATMVASATVTGIVHRGGIFGRNRR